MTLPDDAAWVAKRAHEKVDQYPVKPEFLPEHGVFTCPSYSRPGQAYQVRPVVREAPALRKNTPDRVVFFECTCRAGEFRTGYPVPCYHAAAVARLFCDLAYEYVYLGLTGFVYPRPEVILEATS